MSDTVANLASLLFLGFFLGMRHATDADHVVAIATIVSRQRTLRGSALIGGAWGVGHTLTILVVGGAIILFGVVIPTRVGLAMEFAVGVMLVLLGLLTLTGIGRVIRDGCGVARRDGHRHAHDHGARAYPHDARPRARRLRPSACPRARRRRSRPPRRPDAARPLDRRLGGLTLYQWLRPLVVGIVHGLAGSAAVALLVLAAVRDPAWAMAYLLLFGAGTIVGMMLITMALAAPFAFSWTRLPRFNWQLRVASGLISFGFGLLLIYEIGFTAGGLFTADADLAAALTTCNGLMGAPTCARIAPARQRVFSLTGRPGNRANNGATAAGGGEDPVDPATSRRCAAAGEASSSCCWRSSATRCSGSCRGSRRATPPRRRSAPFRYGRSAREEEAYAAALWPIHREVEARGRGHDLRGHRLQDRRIRIGPGSRPRSSRSPRASGRRSPKARALEVPASMRERARALSRRAGIVRERVGGDGQDGTGRQGRASDRRRRSMSFRATEDMLRVGDVLWPGEYKPH